MGIDVIAISGKRAAVGLTGQRPTVGGTSNALAEVIEIRIFGDQDGGLYVESTGASVSVVKKSILRWVDVSECRLCHRNEQREEDTTAHVRVVTLTLSRSH